MLKPAKYHHRQGHERNGWNRWGDGFRFHSEKWKAKK
jgi:hypothetical protein